MRVLRRKYCTIMARVTVLVLLLMWATLPAYWGALASQATRTRNLTALFIDRDGSRLGHAMWSAFANASAPGPQLGWAHADPDAYPTAAAVEAAVLGEEAWVAVVVEANATANLWRARAAGDAAYDPGAAVTLYYNQARNEIAAGTYIVPLTRALLQSSTGAFATYQAQRYLALIRGGGMMGNGTGTGVVNATALALWAQAPLTVTPAVSWTEVNVRAYTAPVATAVYLVGQIYMCIFT